MEFVVIIGMSTTTHAQTSVTLGWDPSPDKSVAGYRVYEGQASHVYTFTNNVGKATSATLTNLFPAKTYYFAVTAYTTNGLESSFSGEISYTVPAATAARLKVGANGAKQMVLSGTAPAAATYNVLASKDLKPWTSIGVLTVNSNSTFQFTDPGATTNAIRFYRLLQTSSQGVSQPVKAANLRMTVNSSKHVVLTGTAPAAYSYAVLISKDFKTWTTNGTITVGTNNTFQFTDPATATNSLRLYRLRQIAP